MTFTRSLIKDPRRKQWGGVFKIFAITVLTILQAVGNFTPLEIKTIERKSLFYRK